MDKDIRTLNYEQDIQFIKDIWKKHACEEEKWENVDNEIKCTNNRTYVRVKNDSIVAFIVITSKDVDKMKNYIYELFSHPTGQGFGSDLIKEMQKERPFLNLHVKKINEGAKRFYESEGFKINGTNPDGTKHFMEWPIKRK